MSQIVSEELVLPLPSQEAPYLLALSWDVLTLSIFSHLPDHYTNKPCSVWKTNNKNLVCSINLAIPVIMLREQSPSRWCPNYTSWRKHEASMVTEVLCLVVSFLVVATLINQHATFISFLGFWLKRVSLLKHEHNCIPEWSILLPFKTSLRPFYSQKFVEN